MDSNGFKYIRAVYKDWRHVVFDAAGSPKEYEDECATRNIVWGTIILFGVPHGLSDKEYEEEILSESECSIPIGHIRGCIVLCEEIINEGYEPFDICNCADGELECVIDILSSENQPLNESINPFLNLFYINDFKLDNMRVDITLAGRILKELPKLVHTCFHVKPGIIAYFPGFPEDVPVDGQSADRRASEERSVDFDSLELSTDSIRHLEEYLFFRSNGYSEAGGTGLLYLPLASDT